MGPGSAAGEVQWVWRGRRTALPLDSVGWGDKRSAGAGTY
ncbi:hypothetical protein [Devosia sp. DBB001]|nr:hypothetical protein [Devosia sp. DBB001]